MTNDLFFDTDCLSSFLWINNTNILQDLYNGKVVIPEPVYQELSNPYVPHLKQRTDGLIAGQVAIVQEIIVDTEEYRTYESLLKGEKGLKGIGRGEAGGIALAKTYNGILASNNYKDIAPYIKRYNLRHTDTGHILLEALEKNIITEAVGNSMWQQMLAKQRKLPANSFTEYRTNGQ